MLNSVKIIFASTIFLVTSQIHAADVLKFDIQGLKLNDTYAQFKDKYSCKNKKMHRNPNGMVDFVECGKKGRALSRELYVGFDQHGRIHTILREKVFSVKPDLDKIKMQLFEKYGKPAFEGYMKLGHKHTKTGWERTYCWGSCARNNYDNSAFFDGDHAHAAEGIALYVRYTTFNYEYVIVFELKDHPRYSAHREWSHAEFEKQHRKKVEKESNLDL